MSLHSDMFVRILYSIYTPLHAWQSPHWSGCVLATPAVRPHDSHRWCRGCWCSQRSTCCRIHERRPLQAARLHCHEDYADYQNEVYCVEKGVIQLLLLSDLFVTLAHCGNPISWRNKRLIITKVKDVSFTNPLAKHVAPVHCTLAVV